MVLGVPWPALLTLGAGVGNLLLAAYLWRIRERPGAAEFLGVIGCQVLWCFAYGTGLLVTDRFLREALEGLVWIAVAWIGVWYLAFALAYTGRGNVIRSWWFGVAAAFEAVSTVVIVTNSLHGLVWTNFRFDAVAGAATVAYTHEAWIFVQYVALGLLTSVGIYLLLDTVISYGRPYRKQALAVALTPLPPAIAFTVWVFQFEPLYPLNLTAAMFLPHMALDLYALFGSDMFEFGPATRRVGERAAIDDLPSPVVIVDPEGRIVTFNEAAESVFGFDPEETLTRDVDAVTEDTVDHRDPAELVNVRNDGIREVYRLSSSPLENAEGQTVGYTLVFQDVTETRRHEQRLEVLNRVLRHNLRNDLNVVQGNVEVAAERVDDESIEALLRKAIEETQSLVEVGEKARTIERVMETKTDTRTVDLGKLLEDVARDCRERCTEGTVTVDCSMDLRLETSPQLLGAVLENLVENGLEHAGESPTVTVAVDDVDVQEKRVTLCVADDGPGIPAHEVETVTEGEESPLDHGSGLGLWIATWGVRSLGGRLDFETGEDGTTVVVEIPGVADAEEKTVSDRGASSG